MNCPEFHDLLQHRLDGWSGNEPAGLEQHLRECIECRERHVAARRLTEGLPLLVGPAPPADLSQRILSQVLAEQFTGLRFGRRLRVWMAAAAGLLLALAGYQVYRALTEAARNSTPVAQGDPKRGPKKSGQEPSPGPTLDEVGSAALTFTRRTAGDTVAQARRWLPQATPLVVALATGEGGGQLALTTAVSWYFLNQPPRTGTASSGS